MSENRTPAVAEDPFRLGWRYVREVGPDGEETVRQVPLTERDLLFPQEGDFVVRGEAHTRDVCYLRAALQTLLHQRPEIHVFADHRVDFAVLGVEPLGSDILVVDDLPEWDGTRGTLDLAEQGRPLLVVEITWPSTRSIDLGVKRELYARAGVPFYAVVDHQAGRGTEMIVFRLGDGGYTVAFHAEEGRVTLRPLGLAIGLEGGLSCVYDAAGKRVEEMPRIWAQVEEVEQRVKDAVAWNERLRFLLDQIGERLEEDLALRQVVERLAREEEARRHAEAQTNALEQRLRDLEEQLRRSQPEG